ncbi:MAG: anti-sigma F factor antagonist [Halanaerobiales bacterium]
MNIKTVSKNDTLIVRMSGELDLLTVSEFKDRVVDKTEKEGINNLILNLQNVTFIDSSGLGAILGRYRYLDKKGGRVILVSLKPQVERIFKMAGMLTIMDHFSSEQEAVNGLNEGRTA